MDSSGGEGFAPSGFTLIELMVVLMIMTLLASLIVPNVVTAMRGKRLDTTARRLTELVRFASLSAVTRHRPVLLNLDPRRRRCWVTTTTSSLPWQDDAPPARTLTLGSMMLPEGTTLNVVRGGSSEESTETTGTQWEAVTFHPNGRAEDVTIQLADAKGEMDIGVLGVTGDVRTGAGERP